MSRFKEVDGYVVDTWGGGVIIGETAQHRSPRRHRSRQRLPKKVRAQIEQNAAIAVGVLLGVWLSYALWPV